MLRKVHHWLLLAVLFVIPASAAASNDTTWSFQDANSIDPAWNVNRLTGVQLAPQGLLIQTSAEGYISRSVELSHPIEVIEMTVASSQRLQINLLWHPHNQPQNTILQIPIVLSGTGQPEKIQMDLTWFPQWDTHTDLIGFSIPAGGQVLIQDVSVRGWNIFEKSWNALLSFFVFDTMRPYSVNFLWGPMMTYNEVARSQLFEEIPPRGQSVNRVFLSVLGFLLLLLLYSYWIHADGMKKKMFHIFWVTFAVFWVLFDLRMGAEFMTYFLGDLATYHSQPEQSAMFRERGPFNVFAEKAREFVVDEESFVFIASHDWPFIGSMKYYGYPAYMTKPEDRTGNEKVWVIYNRSDFRVENGSLYMNDEVVSEIGEVLLVFNDHSLVYRTLP